MNLPPRLEHNRRLADKAITDLRVEGRYPRVALQAEPFLVEPGHLVRFGYNASIVEDNGGITMAYRFHDGDTLQTRLALAQLDLSGKFHSNRAIPSKNGTSMEDPRLFWHDNRLWLSWVESNYPNTPLRSVVKYGELRAGEIVSTFQPKTPSPQPMEKNWVPFSYGGAINFIYSAWPAHQVFQVVDETVANIISAPGFMWPWGIPRGGTTPLPYKGKWLRFFHSALDNEYASSRRRYYVGALIMETEPPFAVCEWSRSPVLYGSETDTVPHSEWSKCRHRKPNVVFPLGCIARPDHWLLSVGINDYQISIMKIKPQDLNL